MVRVLGPVQLIGPRGEQIDVPSASQRRLLAALALHAPGPVRSVWLCDVLDVTPGAVRTSVSRLRRILGEDQLCTASGGYRLDAPVDAHLACKAIDDASGEPDALGRALDRWTGAALEEFRDEGWAVGEAHRLDAVRADAIEDLADALIQRAQPERAIQILEPHLIEHPNRDRPCGLFIRALAASGRRTEALRAYQGHRNRLGESFGTEPSDDLRAIEQRVAAGWDGMGPSAPGRSTPATARPDRRDPVLAEALRTNARGVGRSAPLTELGEVADRVAEGGTEIVLVTGDVGIGKTTLIADFARTYCHDHRWDVHYARCDDPARGPSQPFPPLVGRIVDGLPDDQLRAHTARCGGDLVRLVPSHADRIGASASPATDEVMARHLLFEATVDVMACAAAQPMLLVIDDLQWAEPAASRLLRYLARNLLAAPLLLAVIVRESGEAPPPHVRDALADLARQRITRIDLQGLDEAELADLVHARVTGAAGRRVGPVAGALHGETSGNPLLADHLLDHWDRSGRLEIAEDGVRLSAALNLDVPSTLRDLVWHRVSLLGEGAEDTLTAAAVLGLQFDERVLAAMAGVDATTVPRLLDRAVAAGILADHPSLAGTVRFTHGLVARALEADLGPRARTRLHAESFAAMLAIRPTSTADLAPRLAHHANAGNLIEEGLHWATEAGDHAFADLAPHEAARWFAIAIDDATTLGRPASVRADLLVRLGRARSRAGDPDAMDTLRRGAELAASIGDTATVIRAAVATDWGTIRIGRSAREQLDIVEAALAVSDEADMATRAHVTALVAQSLIHTNQTERRRATAHAALDLARSCADPAVFATVAAPVLQALWAPGAGPARVALAREAASAVDATDDPRLTFLVHFTAFGSAVCAGQAADASRYLDRLHEVAGEVREPQMRWAIGVLDGFVATMEARFVVAEQTVSETFDLGSQAGVDEALAIFAAQSFTLGTFAGRHAELLPFVEQGIAADATVELPFEIAHALVCCEVGRARVAIDLLHGAMHQGLGAIPDDFLRSTVLLGYAVLALELDDAEAGAWLYPEIVPFVDEVSFNGLTSHGPIAAYAGKLASLLGHTADAERFLLNALTVTEAFQWQYHRATTLFALAQNQFRADGILDERGRDWLVTAEQLCEIHGIAQWAKRAASLRAVAG